MQRMQNLAKRIPGFLQRRYLRLKAFLAHGGLRRIITMFNAKYPDLEFRLLDIGARRGREGRYNSLTRLNHFYVEGIEPDKKESEAVLARGVYGRIHPIAVADEIGKRRLYITKVLGCTSLHRPKWENLERYAISSWFEIQKETDVAVTTLDAFYAPSEKFDFISMDVQGAEYEVIKGGERLFDHVLGFSLEVHFVEIYEGQKLFSFIHDFCLEKGFRLILMSHCDFDGEIAEAECVYVRDHKRLVKKQDYLKCILFAF